MREPWFFDSHAHYDNRRFQEDQKELLRSIDVLIDGPFLLAEKSLEVPFRGSRNQRILDVPKSLAAGTAVETTQLRWLGEY